MILKVFKLPGWVTRRYQAVLDWDTQEVLWPEGCSWDFLMAEKLDNEKAGEASVWYSEYMCTIISDEEQLFKPHYNRYYRGYVVASRAGKAFIHITHRAKKKDQLDEGVLAQEEIIPVNLFMGVDPASSTSIRADYSVNFVIALAADWNIYLLPYYHKRVPPTDHAKSIVRMYEEYYPRRTTPEATGYQEALRDILRKFSHLWSKDGKRLYIPGLEAKVLPKEKKTKRHKTALHIHFYQRHVWFLEGMEALESELSMWREDKTKMDDLIDGMYFAMLKMFPPTHEYTPEKTPGGLVVRSDFEDDFDEDWTMA